jgi:S-disulfanyl-L-cysteine oxidoreductase SoxD
MSRRITTAPVIALVVSLGCYGALRAQDTRSVWDGVYTEQQAKRGAAIFDRECAGCHGPEGGGGGMAPALVGSAFSANYDGQMVGDLFDRNRTTMPVGREGQLSGQQNADITAFMLQVNKFPAGSAELSSQSIMLKQIRYLSEKPAAKPQGGASSPSADVRQASQLLREGKTAVRAQEDRWHELNDRAAARLTPFTASCEGGNR